MAMREGVRTSITLLFAAGARGVVVFLAAVSSVRSTISTSAGALFAAFAGDLPLTGACSAFGLASPAPLAAAGFLGAPPPKKLRISAGMLQMRPALVRREAARDGQWTDGD